MAELTPPPSQQGTPQRNTGTPVGGPLPGSPTPANRASGSSALLSGSVHPLASSHANQMTMTPEPQEGDALPKSKDLDIDGSDEVEGEDDIEDFEDGLEGLEGDKRGEDSSDGEDHEIFEEDGDVEDDSKGSGGRGEVDEVGDGAGAIEKEGGGMEIDGENEGEVGEGSKGSKGKGKEGLRRGGSRRSKAAATAKTSAPSGTPGGKGRKGKGAGAGSVGGGGGGSKKDGELLESEIVHGWNREFGDVCKVQPIAPAMKA